MSGGRGRNPAADRSPKPFSWKNWAAMLLGMVSAGFFLCMGIFDIQKAAPLVENISLACGENGITEEELEEIRAWEQEKEGGLEFTAWNLKPQAYVADVDGYRSICVEAMELNGSSEWLLPYGRILHEDDKEGCILGAGAAWELFGSRNVEGLTLCYGERELTIRGVLQTPENLIVVEADERTERFWRITLKRQENVSEKMSVERFAGSYGLDVTQICFELFSRERLLSLIPGKWSDFSGWSGNLKELWQDAAVLISVEKSSLELVWLTLWGKALLWIGLGMLCMFRCWKNRASAVLKCF